MLKSVNMKTGSVGREGNGMAPLRKGYLAEPGSSEQREEGPSQMEEEDVTWEENAACSMIRKNRAGVKNQRQGKLGEAGGATFPRLKVRLETMAFFPGARDGHRSRKQCGCGCVFITLLSAM